MSLNHSPSRRSSGPEQIQNKMPIHEPAPPTLTRRDMRYWVMKPDRRLRSRVFCYYLAHPVAAEQWDSVAAYKDVELLIPDGHAEIVFQLGGAFERRCVDDAAGAVMRHSYLIGGRSQSVLTRDLDRVTVAGVKLDPRLLHGLIRAPLGEFSEGTVRITDLDDPSVSSLEASIAGAAHCPAQVAGVLDQFFLRALATARPSSPRIDALVREIHAHRGALSILDWIRGHGFDPRNIERRFSDAMGMTPKRYARVIRFKHQYHALVSGKTSAEYMDGFHDRSHFNKEFRRFVGVPPTVRMNASLPQGTSISDTLLHSELATA
jgi:AraC-like DNA-binding protein